MRCQLPLFAVHLQRLRGARRLTTRGRTTAVEQNLPKTGRRIIPGMIYCIIARSLSQPLERLRRFGATSKRIQGQVRWFPSVPLQKYEVAGRIAPALACCGLRRVSLRIGSTVGPESRGLRASESTHRMHPSSQVRLSGSRASGFRLCLQGLRKTGRLPRSSREPP